MPAGMGGICAPTHPPPFSFFPPLLEKISFRHILVSLGER